MKNGCMPKMDGIAVGRLLRDKLVKAVQDAIGALIGMESIEVFSEKRNIPFLRGRSVI